MKLDIIFSSHYTITKELLPPPHETRCFSYSKLNFTNPIACVEQCIVDKSFQKWGAISISSLIPNNVVDYKFVKPRNYTKFNSERKELESSWESSCPNTSCEDTQIVTIQENSAYVGIASFFEGNTSIGWVRLTPSFPSIAILCRPTTTLPYLILYMMSSVSTWTGLSMMSFNPSLLLQSLSKIKSAPRISPLDRLRRGEIAALNHTVRMSRFENRLLSQSLAIERLRQMVFHLLKDRRSSIR